MNKRPKDTYIDMDLTYKAQFGIAHYKGYTVSYRGKETTGKNIKGDHHSPTESSSKCVVHSGY